MPSACCTRSYRVQRRSGSPSSGVSLTSGNLLSSSRSGCDHMGARSGSRDYARILCRARFRGSCVRVGSIPKRAVRFPKRAIKVECWFCLGLCFLVWRQPQRMWVYRAGLIRAGSMLETLSGCTHLHLNLCSRSHIGIVSITIKIDAAISHIRHEDQSRTNRLLHLLASPKHANQFRLELSKSALWYGPF